MPKFIERFKKRTKENPNQYSITEYCENLQCLADEAVDIFYKKAQEYEDNWQEVPVEELAAVVKTKAAAYTNQVKNKGDPESILHHAADMINWITMLACRGVEE